MWNCGLGVKIRDAITIYFNLRWEKVGFKEGAIPAEEKVLLRRASAEESRHLFQISYCWLCVMLRRC